jgi:SAM-dependent methyltransferase
MSTIERKYDEQPDYEWQRLERHRIEYGVTLKALAEYMPPAPASVADIGGGPGRYAIELTGRGYEVTLVDLSRGNIELAKVKAAKAGVEIRAYLHGNATRLDFMPAEEFDVVLLMGPLYHLLEEEQREKAVSEALRLLKPGGVIFAAFITRYAGLRWAAKHMPEYLDIGITEHDMIMQTGRRIAQEHSRFPDSYYAHPTEIRPFMEEFGLMTLNLVGCEGIIAKIEDKVNEIEGELWETWVREMYRVGKDPSTHGASDHLLYIGRKR